MQDLEVFKQIPGYKAILKAVLKNQIQSLVQQLAKQTGEESVLITASLEEGTLSQLGSEFGKTFLEGHDEIKSQFLGFCLKRNQIQKQTKEFQESKPRKSWSVRRPSLSLPTVARRSEPYPVSMTKAISKSANQKAARTEHGRRKQNKTLKTETVLPYEEYNLPKNLQMTPLSTQSQGHGSESQSPQPDIPSIKNEPMYANDLIVTENSINSVNTDTPYDQLNENENQSTQNSLTDDLYGEAEGSEMAMEGRTDVTDDVLDEQVDGVEDLEQDVVDEVYGDEEVQVEGQGQLAQGQGQSKNEQLAAETEAEGSISMIQVQNILPKRQQSEARKPKIRLFNQNKRSNMQKSLKERKAELENYLNLENTERPYPCNLCPKRFKERHHLVYHLRTHSGHRPYVCSICNKGFTQSSSLNTHKKLHLKDMSCEYCGLVFRKISLLQNHVCKALADDNIQI